MSYKILQKIQDIPVDKTTAIQQSILVALAFHAHEDGGGIYPSIARLRKETHLSRSTIQSELHYLTLNLKLLTVVNPGGGRLATEYKFNLQVIVELSNPTCAVVRKSSKSCKPQLKDEVYRQLFAPRHENRSEIEQETCPPHGLVQPATRTPLPVTRAAPVRIPDSNLNITGIESTSNKNLINTFAQISSERASIEDPNNLFPPIPPKPPQPPRTVEEAKKSISEVLSRGAANHSGNGVDLYDVSDYPPDVQEIIRLFSESWKIVPPRRSKTKNGQFAFWIKSARELLEACQEFGLETIRQVHKEFELHMATHEGVAMNTIYSPRSIVGAARGMAGKMRREGWTRQTPMTPDELESYREAYLPWDEVWEIDQDGYAVKKNKGKPPCQQ